MPRRKPETKPIFNKPRPEDDIPITTLPVKPGRPGRPGNGPWRPNKPIRPPRVEPPVSSDTQNPIVPVKPDLPQTFIEGPAPEPVKPATPDLIVFEDDALPIEVMSDLIFENIGGQELINISRNDLVNGQSLVYRPIKNLSSLATKYGSRTLIPLQDTSSSYFANFPIKFENYLPEFGTGPAGASVYIEPVTNNLVIDVINLEDDERVEVQILASGSVLNDTIYTEEES